MDNYPYIIGGLPILSADFEVRSFDYGKIRDTICKSLSEKDCKLVEFLEFGFKDDNLGTHFYDLCSQKSNRFIREYYDFDLKVRKAKVAFISGKPEKDDSDDGKGISSVLEEKDIIERERRLDSLYWSKIDGIVKFDVLDINIILAFLAKAHIVDRWGRLDKEKGAEFLSKLVEDVRGTFQGVKYE
ncbi:MAG: DUF2764 domain-containing protein [Bacteroidales bacterium]|jgi:hypothetical protein|nr:DUF2764 domain-containing protein [Bacteroidales bacterium]MCI2122502.1 DUF2764 domain-containing protein [Bacteroidales bacterium]MCI2144692.1 DUF2764 domain-containing protein [Bacteroidales bacterium]